MSDVSFICVLAQSLGMLIYGAIATRGAVLGYKGFKTMAVLGWTSGIAVMGLAFWLRSTLV